MEIHIGDINDNPPVFANAEYTLEVEENVKVGSPVGNTSVTAT